MSGLAPVGAPLLDRLGRPLGSLRLSVTDRCNMRCGYCMPEADYVWLPRESILTFEELARVARLFADLGVIKVRLTGGEPLLRHDLPTLVRMLRADRRIHDLALTTNGLLLARAAKALRSAGLDRVTVSLDTLMPARALAFARTTRHADTLAGIAAARDAGLGLKLNTVLIRGMNDDEIESLVEHAQAAGAELRFIEYMDVGGATQWSMADVVPRAEILARLERHFGAVVPLAENAVSNAPADRFRLPDGTVVGIIASTTAPFCRSCDRSRLTADGSWLLCLYAADGVDLRELLRGGVDDAAIRAVIAERWAARADRGAEQRLEVGSRSALYQLGALRADPRREMHTRGG